MREIKFRGKRVDNGEWVYGSYVHWSEADTHCIVDDYCIGDNIGWNVKLSTVSQCAGLKDKNGVDIYEGDILKGYEIITDEGRERVTLVIEFSNAAFGTRFIQPCYDSDENVWSPLWSEKDGELYSYYALWDVVSNIYDNPEFDQSKTKGD